jgi:hypothetical protein
MCGCSRDLCVAGADARRPLHHHAPLSLAKSRCAQNVVLLPPSATARVWGPAAGWQGSAPPKENSESLSIRPADPPIACMMAKPSSSRVNQGADKKGVHGGREFLDQNLSPRTRLRLSGARDPLLLLPRRAAFPTTMAARAAALGITLVLGCVSAEVHVDTAKMWRELDAHCSAGARVSLLPHLHTPDRSSCSR